MNSQNKILNWLASAAFISAFVVMGFVVKYIYDVQRNESVPTKNQSGANMWDSDYIFSVGWENNVIMAVLFITLIAAMVIIISVVEKQSPILAGTMSFIVLFFGLIFIVSSFITIKNSMYDNQKDLFTQWAQERYHVDVSGLDSKQVKNLLDSSCNDGILGTEMGGSDECFKAEMNPETGQTVTVKNQGGIIYLVDSKNSDKEMKTFIKD